MSELPKITRWSPTMISTFSGAGGSSLGFRMAGFRVLYASEFVPVAREVYQLNSQRGTIVDDRDIRNVTPEEILAKVGKEVGQVDVVEGSPPCASFSTAGKREQYWGDVRKYSETAQQTDDLFFEYIRIVRGIQPKVFVAENVAGLAMGVAKGYFVEILDAMRAAGYNVMARKLNAQWLGVPQSRERVIFMGVRKDLNIQPVYPTPRKERVSIEEAFSEPMPLHEADDPAINHGIHFGTKVSAEWKRLTYGEQSERYFQFVKPHPKKPMHTITTSAVYGHYDEPRRFSMREMRRLFSFPDDFQVTGSFTQQWERFARSVPPLMMKAVAETVRDQILCAD